MCPSTNEWAEKMWHIYIYIYIYIYVYTPQWNIIQPEKEGNPAICDQMDKPEGIMLSEVSQTKTNTIRSHLYMDSKRKKKLKETESICG